MTQRARLNVNVGPLKSGVHGRPDSSEENQNLIGYLQQFPAWLFTLLAALIAGLVALEVRRLNSFVAASSAFRAAFAPELSALESRSALPQDLNKFLLASFPKHREAVTCFEPQVAWYRRPCFTRAWHEYHSGHQFKHQMFGISDAESYFLEYVGMEYTEGSSAEAARVLAAKRLRKVLSYARST